MKISVIVPVYNCEKYLEKCIKAILNQTYQDFELILVNNGSIDNSAMICARYADEDKRIVYLLKENSGGAGEPRNKGIEEARGEYIVFVDSDDYLEPDALETLYNTAISMDYDVVIASYHNFSEDKMINYNTILEPAELVSEHEVRDYFASVYPNGEAGYLWNKIYKSDVIKHFDVRFPDMARLEDGFFNVDYFSHISKCKIIEKVTYNYKLNDQKDLFRKSPDNYFELVHKLVEHYYMTVDNWSLNPYLYERELIKFALNELEVCFENAICGGWEMDKEQRLEYYESIKTLKRSRHLLEHRRFTGRYVSMVMGLFANGHYGVMEWIVKFKVMMKKSFKIPFMAIKKIIN